MRIVVCIILGILLMSCAEQQLEPGTTPNTFFPEQDDARPVFDRTPVPDQPFPENEEVIEPAKNQSVFIRTHSGVTQLRIPLNYPLGWVWPVLTKQELPLLRPTAIRTEDNQFRSYEQFIQFDFNATGNVSFVVDESRGKDYVGTVLYFMEDEPYFEYSMLLNDRLLYDPAVIGGQFTLLGRVYQLMEANNFTIWFNGIDIEQYFRISRDERLETNRNKISHSQGYYDGHDFSYVLNAPDLDDNGFWLREGESLRQRLTEEFQADALLGDFDLRYDGIEPFESGLHKEITLKVRDEYIELVWDGPEGIVRVPLLGVNEDGFVWHGSGEKRIHLQECETDRIGCVFEGELIVLFGRLPSRGAGPFTTRMLELSGLDPDERKIIFRDAITRERMSVDWIGGIGDRSDPARAYVPFLDHEYVMYVHGREENITDPNNSSDVTTIIIPESLSIDLDGDGGVHGDNVPLIIDEGLEVWLENLIDEENATSYVLNISIEAGQYDRAQRQYNRGVINKEHLLVQAVYDDGFSVRVPIINETIWDQELLLDPDDGDYAFGLSPWGSFITLETDSNDAQETSEEILIDVPFVQRFALVSVGDLS